MLVPKFVQSIFTSKHTQTRSVIDWFDVLILMVWRGGVSDLLPWVCARSGLHFASARTPTAYSRIHAAPYLPHQGSRQTSSHSQIVHFSPVLPWYNWCDWIQPLRLRSRDGSSFPALSRLPQLLVRSLSTSLRSWRSASSNRTAGSMCWRVLFAST